MQQALSSPKDRLAPAEEIFFGLDKAGMKWIER